MAKKLKSNFYPTALTIAGSDSGGGAGIAADLRTFNAFGVFGTCAITALTSQNPAAVRRIDPAPADAVTTQIDAVMEKIAVRFCKTGMLFSAEIVRAAAAAIRKHQLKLVCDPVMISTSGTKLLEDDAVEAIKSELLPLASWITPNIPEAEYLTGGRITNTGEMMAAAEKLYEKYSCSVLLKGGHLGGGKAVDAVVKGGKKYFLSAPLLNVAPLASHGTGCTLSAALTAMLALDFPWKQAVCESKAFVYGSLDQCVEIGGGGVAMYPPAESFSQIVTLEEAE
jgi:hydroxymethylpyrimidine/phosphomethylpyrimidine kinase